MDERLGEFHGAGQEWQAGRACPYYSASLSRGKKEVTKRAI